MTYAGAYMKRQIDGEFDYSDYSYFYDKLSGYGAYWYDNDYNPIDPSQYIVSDDSFKKMSHELRFTSPADKRLRMVGGLFYQRQEHNIEQNYIIDNLADWLVVPGTESNIWLTKQLRVDAVGEAGVSPYTRLDRERMPTNNVGGQVVVALSGRVTDLHDPFRRSR